MPNSQGKACIPHIPPNSGLVYSHINPTKTACRANTFSEQQGKSIMFYKPRLCVRTHGRLCFVYTEGHWVTFNGGPKECGDQFNRV